MQQKKIKERIKTKKQVAWESAVKEQVTLATTEGRSVDLALIDEISEKLALTREQVFNSPAVRKALPAFDKSKNANNPNFMEIYGENYHLVFKVGRYTKADKHNVRMYLVRDNEPHAKFTFTKSGRTAEILLRLSPRSQRFTHLDNAMYEAVQWIRKQKVAQS